MGKKFLFVIGLFFIPAFVFAGNLFINDNNAGNVGIGTSSTNYAKLNVKILANELEGIHINRSSGLTTPYSYFNIENESGSAVFKIDQSGNVGIGTSSPSKKLDIVGNGINLENTTFANQSGIIYKNGVPFIHNFSYGNNGTVTTSGKNIFIGENAGNFTMGSTSTQTGFASNNIGVGEEVFKNNITGHANLAVGNFSLNSNTTGRENVSLGNSSLRLNTTGGQNTAVGFTSLNKNIDGGANAALGWGTLYKNTSGGSNSVLGYASLFNNTTGSNNSALGVQSLYYNVNGGSNSAVGYRSLFSNISGTYNSALGNSSLNNNTTGYYNLAVGASALYSNITGYYNSAVGAYSLNSNTTGLFNSAVGVSSLTSNTTGSYNIAIGNDSGRYIADGTSPNQTSSNSVYLGSKTKALASGDTNEIVIGHEAIGVGSNSVVLGNDSITKTVLKGNVGIGVTSPSDKLTVAGNIGLGSYKIYNGASNNSAGIDFNSSWINLYGYNGIKFYSSPAGIGSQIERMRLTNTGNLGIGVTSPQARLTILKNQWIASANSDGTSNINMFRVNSNGEIQVGAPLIAGTLSASEDTGATTLFNMPVSSSSTQGTEMSASISIDYTPILKIYSESDGSGGVQNEAVKITGDADITGDLNISDNANISGILKVGNFATNPLGSANVCNSNYMGGVIYNSTGDVMCYCMESSGVYMWKRFDGVADCF